MVEILKVKNTQGIKLEIYCCWFTLSDKQQFIVVDCDLGIDLSDAFQGGAPGVVTEPMGFLEDQGAIFEIRTRNSLATHDWDFRRFPNPQLILITDRR
jgi:hypothetical protein